VKVLSLVVVAGVLIWRVNRTQPATHEAVAGVAGTSAPLAGAGGARSSELHASLLAGMRENALNAKEGGIDNGPPQSESARRAQEWMDDRYSSELENLVFDRHFAKLEKIRLESDDDLKWSGQTEDGIQALFKNELNGLGAPEEVACRGYLCRVEASLVRHNNRPAITRKIQVALRLEQVTVQMQREKDRFVAYFAREGRILPEWDFEEYLAPEMAAAEKDNKLWPITNNRE
jgi:hypothetical protein